MSNRKEYPGLDYFRIIAAFLRPAAMWIYLLHPLWIIGIRGIAGILRLETLVVDNHLVLYLLTGMVSFLAAILFCWIGK